MGQGVIHVYSGDGHGKSSAALGKAVQAASMGKSVVIIQFLKGLADNSFIKRLEPEIKFFRFEKSDADFNLLSDAEKAEEIQNIKNGLNFAKKVLATGGCDLLILDEVLGLIDNQIISVEDLMTIINTRDEETSVIITGIQLDNELCRVADEISKIETVKYKVW
ncbi:MAG: cob(I)yrinic acid a,c-diamide adenosyltransferase [Lachnospiraceae bacterium]|nr:cob(I)yrinic acid a,c-diamide adenosyltransferase [Lachnospiraceae bacterium]MDD3660324.1 cob(I)yrinic acid a,c-diamide adenosyltransferase [Lachnospiraceae bacterium]